jgi:hypothetical protein
MRCESSGRSVRAARSAKRRMRAKAANKGEVMGDIQASFLRRGRGRSI